MTASTCGRPPRRGRWPGTRRRGRTLGRGCDGRGRVLLLLLIRPELRLTGADFRRDRIGLDELRGLSKHGHIGFEILAEDEQPGLADLAGLFVALALGQ